MALSLFIEEMSPFMIRPERPLREPFLQKPQKSQLGPGEDAV